MKAISFNNNNCVKLLLRFGADPTIANNVNRFLKLYSSIWYFNNSILII